MNVRSPLWLATSALGAVTVAGAAILASSVADTPGPPLDASRRQARARMIEKLKTKQAKPFDQPQEALDFYWAKRSPDGEAMSIVELEEAAAEAAALPVHDTVADTVSSAQAAAASTTAVSGSWQPLGPGNIGGRSRALLVHRKNHDLMWTAGVAGGIWKSTNGGASWLPKADLLVNIAVNSLIQDPLFEHILYAGTGEGFFNGDAVRGQGIFKSTDYGETWTQLPATRNADFYYVQKLAATRKPNVNGNQRLYAATRTGVFRSNDGGTTWSKVLDGTSVNGCMDLAIQEKDLDFGPSYVFASCGTLAQATIWRALDVADGQTWEPVLREVDMGRTSLAIAPSNPDVIYALASFFRASGSAQNYALRAVYRSTQAGAAGSWEARVQYTTTSKIDRVQLTNPVYAFLADCGYGPSNVDFNQGWYDNQIAVDPRDPNVVWTAGIDLMRSDDGGATWGLASYWWFDAGDPNYAHADNHAITFHPKYNGDTNRVMFAASDGGIHRTDDARAAVGRTLAAVCGTPVANAVRWRSLNNGYEVTQFYHGAVYPDGNRFFGGTQDNGTLRGGLGTGTTWEMIRGGDGGYVAVNRNDTNVLYGEYTGKSLERSLDGGVNWAPIHTTIMEAAGNYQFIHPFAMDPTNSDRLWYGGASAYRSNDRGTTWTRVSNSFGARIASWAVSTTDPNRVYVGMQNLTVAPAFSGRIYTTTSATTLAAPVTWPSAQPRQGYVSSVAIDPANPAVAYATYSTYNTGPHVGHVFKTTDGGATWARIDLTLPDMPVHSVVVHPSRPETLYIGTDLGVFVTVDGGGSWLRENTGFANVATEHLELNNGRLFAFTHGRSLFSVALAP